MHNVLGVFEKFNFAQRWAAIQSSSVAFASKEDRVICETGDHLR